MCVPCRTHTAAHKAAMTTGYTAPITDHAQGCMQTAPVRQCTMVWSQASLRGAVGQLLKVVVPAVSRANRPNGLD